MLMRPATEWALQPGKGGRAEWPRGKGRRGKGSRTEERAKLAETSRAAGPSRGHPASWQRLPVTSRAGVWGWGGGEMGMQDTAVFVYLIRGEKRRPQDQPARVT